MTLLQWIDPHGGVLRPGVWCLQLPDAYGLTLCVS